ncbi:uncharacterized protein LOC133183952 [Saccostrea echinata]|uniref:uncharacterized protein LOC133183952 n=1 Tax=Saccostrea echinata TaxID=191078 RepID=UPI002A829644|nr:uncharacterized protein LOC133183952 [Saccostrea echinata]
MLKDGEVIVLKPGDAAHSFSLWTLSGKFDYPTKQFNKVPLIIHYFDPTSSAFLDCLWNSDEALLPIVQNDTRTHFLFIPSTNKVHAQYGAEWMYNRINTLVKSISRSEAERRTKMNQFHFSVLPLWKLGNWLPTLLREWECVDHNCGYDQVLIQSDALDYPTVLKRLDAHYDWLPSPVSAFGNKTLPLILTNSNGCQPTSSVNGSVALITTGGCSYFKKMQAMHNSGAIGVLVMQNKTEPPQDMNCQDSECSSPVPIPASMIENFNFPPKSHLNITFQNTPSPNFFAAIDPQGLLQEVGWFLYPSMSFINWQTQWFQYKENLTRRLQRPAQIIQVFKEQVMQGQAGVVANISTAELTNYQGLELDMSLSCPGDKDTTCGHWDHGISLFVCCNPKSPLCGMEIGRWISPFRRRIGRWLTDISPLLPVIQNNQSAICKFTMKTAPWAMPWIPSLNLRLYKRNDSISPSETFVLYQPGATFDIHYNSHFKPYSFTPPIDVKKVVIFAVITGHGSDENGCGEFCVTSHHFSVNGHINNITFSEAGTPLGCANQVLNGVEPNEHGTWLYGRNGWCDGRNVFPWVIDITQQVSLGKNNQITYFGWFNGTVPNPKQNPGMISIYSYLVYYRS